VPGALVEFALKTDMQPDGTKLAPWLRTGSTPDPDGKHWTEWLSLEKTFVPGEAMRRHRWAQLRFDLSTSKPQASPRIPGTLRVEYKIQLDTVEPAQLLVEGGDRERFFRPTSVPFVYQEPSARLTLLRERYRLDKVIAPGKTEMEQLMLLRHWVRN